ncbi:MAG: PHP domain-containing protein [Clostridia bacterium]|nr:PHP domain-containing protein [Clostridia bacterium]
MNTVLKIDLHMHTAVSDGTDTPAELPAKVKAAGVDVFAVTDHDSVKACAAVGGAAEAAGLRFVPGVEFSCRDEEGKYHVLGYGFDPEAPALTQVVEKGHRLRMTKVKARLDFLRTEFGFTFPEDEIARLLALDNPGKPHIGNLMVKYGYAKTKEEAIERYINGVHFRNEYVRPEEAIAGVLGAGGVPVLAHPAYGSGDQLIMGKEMDARLRRLTDFGLKGIEAYYSGFSPKIRNELLTFAERYDLLITAGSDYHGQNKLIELGDTGLADGEPLPDRLQRFVDAVLP